MHFAVYPGNVPGPVDKDGGVAQAGGGIALQHEDRNDQIAAVQAGARADPLADIVKAHGLCGNRVARARQECLWKDHQVQPLGRVGRRGLVRHPCNKLVHPVEALLERQLEDSGAADHRADKDLAREAVAPVGGRLRCGRTGRASCAAAGSTRPRSEARAKAAIRKRAARFVRGAIMGFSGGAVDPRGGGFGPRYRYGGPRRTANRGPWPRAGALAPSARANRREGGAILPLEFGSGEISRPRLRMKPSFSP